MHSLSRGLEQSFATPVILHEFTPPHFFIVVGPAICISGSGEDLQRSTHQAVPSRRERHEDPLGFIIRYLTDFTAG
jgi:hypothetical protein